MKYSSWTKRKQWDIGKVDSTHTLTHRWTTHRSEPGRAEWIIYFVFDGGSRKEASVVGGDGVQRNETFALLAVFWQSVGGGHGLSIIITVIILTTIIIIIILQQMGASIHRRMESITAAERVVSRACTSDYGLNWARQRTTNWVYCPCENVREERGLTGVSELRSNPF